MKDGDYIGARAPYGYRKDPDDCHKLLIDENTAPVVKQIFEWAHEHVALNRIVRNLNALGTACVAAFTAAMRIKMFVMCALDSLRNGQAGGIGTYDCL